jgi:hypothetical protein
MSVVCGGPDMLHIALALVASTVAPTLWDLPRRVYHAVEWMPMDVEVKLPPLTVGDTDEATVIVSFRGWRLPGVELLVDEFEPNVAISTWKNGVAFTNVRGEATLLIETTAPGIAKVGLRVVRPADRLGE